MAIEIAPTITKSTCVDYFALADAGRLRMCSGDFSRPLFPIDHPHPQQDDRAAEDGNERDRFANHEGRQHRRDQRFDVQERAQLGGGQGLQRVVPGDVGEARAEDAEHENRTPAFRRKLRDFTQSRSKPENPNATEKPAKEHHVEHHARRGVT